MKRGCRNKKSARGSGDYAKHMLTLKRNRKHNRGSACSVVYKQKCRQCFHDLNPYQLWPCFHIKVISQRRDYPLVIFENNWYFYPAWWTSFVRVFGLEFLLQNRKGDRILALNDLCWRQFITITNFIVYFNHRRTFLITRNNRSNTSAFRVISCDFLVKFRVFET